MIETAEKVSRNIKQGMLRVVYPSMITHNTYQLHMPRIYCHSFLTKITWSLALDVMMNQLKDIYVSNLKYLCYNPRQSLQGVLTKRTIVKDHLHTVCLKRRKRLKFEFLKDNERTCHLKNNNHSTVANHDLSMTSNIFG